MTTSIISSRIWGNSGATGNRCVLAAIALTGVVVGWTVVIQQQSKKSNEENKKLPPTPDMGLIEYLTNFLGYKGPMFALKIAREIGYIYQYPPDYLFSDKWVVVAEPKLARQILENSQNTKPKLAYEVFDLAVSGQTFFTLDGPRANHVRKSTAVAFSPKNIKNMESVVCDAVENWISESLQPSLETGEPIDIGDALPLLTTDVISRAAFDLSFNIEERIKMATILRDTMEIFFHQQMNPFKMLFGGFFPQVRAARKMAIEMKNFGHRIIKTCRENPKPNTQSVVYLMIHDDAYKDDEERARDIALYFFAGYETTSHSIAWTLLELARHQDEQQKLREALKEFSVKEPDTNPQYCPRLRNITREILRLYTPAALGSVRQLAEDLIVPPADTTQQFIIPKGTNCTLSYYCILRNHNVFDRPDDFVPSRWENPTDEMQNAFIPFAVGKRNCLGMGLANLELNTVVATLCQRYSLELVDEGEPLYMITLKPKGSKILIKLLGQ